MMLYPRGNFNDSHSHSINHTCPAPNESGPPIVPLVSGLTFQHVAIIAAGAMTALTCVLSFALIMSHALHFSAPQKQKQIIRITFTIPVFAIMAFLTILLESRAKHLTPLGELYDAWALAGFFFLLCEFVSSNSEERERILEEHGKLGVYNRAWFFVFQQPVVMTVLVVVQEITEAAGVYCLTSNKVQFAHVWISTLSTTATTVAVIAVLRFNRATKELTQRDKPFLKLLAYKAIVFLSTTQAALFSFLASSGHLKANNHLSFNDLAVAIPALIVAVEMVFFAIIFPFAYPISPYTRNRNSLSNGLESEPEYHGGFLGVKALFAALNVFDLIQGILVAPMNLARGRAMAKEERRSSK